jgi:hypothetical protein
MDLFKIFNLERSPLPLALFIYLIVSIFIVKLHPEFLFGENDNEFSDKSDKTIWMFFLLLAVFIFAVVSAFTSSKIQSNYCNMLKSSNLKEIIDLSKCKK